MMKFLKVTTGLFAFFGAFVVAALTWLLALTWWASADITKAARRYWS